MILDAAAPRDRPVIQGTDIAHDLAARRSDDPSFLLVLPNDLPKSVRGCQACCAVVVRVCNAAMGMVQKCAGEMGVVTAVAGGGGGGTGAEHMRAHLETESRKVVMLMTPLTLR